jgi:electron transport complex protein RnfG
MRSRVTWRGAAAFALVVASVPAASAQGISRDEALAGVYPGAQIRAEQIFLTGAQVKAAASAARSEITTPLVARYVASRDGMIVGRAYVDTHTIRSKKESLLISLDSAGRVLRVDVTAFMEPLEYRASDPWLRQYRGRGLDDELGLNRAIRPIAGATLTARATTAAVRRILAIDSILTSRSDR